MGFFDFHKFLCGIELAAKAFLGEGAVIHAFDALSLTKTLVIESEENFNIALFSKVLIPNYHVVDTNVFLRYWDVLPLHNMAKIITHATVATL